MSKKIKIVISEEKEVPTAGPTNQRATKLAQQASAKAKTTVALGPVERALEILRAEMEKRKDAVSKAKYVALITQKLGLSGEDLIIIGRKLKGS